MNKNQYSCGCSPDSGCAGASRNPRRFRYTHIVVWLSAIFLALGIWLIAILSQ
jgi:hypothetical protein